LKVLGAVLKLSGGGALWVTKLGGREPFRSKCWVGSKCRIPGPPLSTPGSEYGRRSGSTRFGKFCVEALGGYLWLPSMNVSLRGIGHIVRNVGTRWMVLHRLPPLAVVDFHPVINAVFGFPRVLKGLGEKITEVIVVWLVLESKVANITQILVEFLCKKLVRDWRYFAQHTREGFAEILDGGCLFLFTNLFVLLLIRRGLQALPWKSAAEEVHEDVTEGLKIIPTRLFSTQMGIYTHVTSSSGQRLAFSIGNVLFSLWIAVLLRHAKINNVDNIGGLGSRPADKEIIRLDVTVYEVSLMNCLHPR
jgi:hypothetical protein